MRLLWPDKAETTVKSVYGTFLAQQVKERKDEAAKRLSYYYSDQLEYLETQLQKAFAEPDKMIPIILNITRKVINSLARVYIEPPTRTVIDGSQKDIDTFNEISSSSALNRKLKTAHRFTKLLGTTVLKPIWRNNKLDLDILTPDILDVEWGDTPEDLKSLMITYYPLNGKVEEIEYSRWSNAVIERLDYRFKIISSEPNPYGILPFIPCWDRSPSNDFWLTTMDDLIACQEAVNSQITDLGHVLRLQGFGQAVVTGLDRPTAQLLTGPGKVITLPKDGDFKYSATNSPIAEIISAIDFLIGKLCISYGLSSHNLVTDPTGESGLSKLVSSAEVDEIRQDDIELWRDYEHNLFDVIKTVWNYHNPGKKLSDSASLKIDFFDPKPELTPDQQATAWQKLLELGVINEVDIIMQMNPDIESREDALGYLLQLQSERSALGERVI